MHYVCVFIFSHPVSSASFFSPWVQPMCWWCSFVFSRLQPALVTRFDLTYPGVTSANYLASLWYLFWMWLFFFPLFSCCCGGGGVFCCGGSSVLRNITSVPMFRHCVTSAWNSSEGLNNRPLGLQPEPPFEETHLCSEITFIFSKYVWHKWNQFMWCSSFFPCDVCFGVNMSFSVIAADIWWLLLHMRYIDHWEKFMLGSVSVRMCVNEHLWKIYQFLH